MQTLPIIYLTYMFVMLYMFFFFLLIYLRNRKDMNEIPIAKRNYTVSIIVPCYNEEDAIEGTIKSLLDSDYKGLRKVIVVDDCSKDNSYKIIKAYAARDKRVIGVRTPQNMGRAASAKNFGIKYANTDIIGFSDADSFPEKDAIRKCLGYFNDEKVGAVTCSVLVKHRNLFIEKLQAMEYAIIAWSRKLLGYVDGIWAMPGPLALYRREVIEKTGGFDENSLTEDIEITWNVVSLGYKVEMCLPARVYSIAPTKFRYWVKQRIRWDIGGIQCMNKYKSNLAGKLGYFIIPFFTLSMFMGLFGLCVFFYVAARNIASTYLFAGYSIAAKSSLLTLEELNITPTVLNFFGLSLFILGFIFTVFALSMMKEYRFRGFRNIFNLMFYLIVYLTVYPFILVLAIGKMIRYRIAGKKIGWGTR
jgi:cellulose synthase/poly-beta-1,6-N-acetylglucosamine synthase-like glycosyltransferase